MLLQAVNTANNVLVSRLATCLEVQQLVRERHKDKEANRHNEVVMTTMDRIFNLWKPVVRLKRKSPSRGQS